MNINTTLQERAARYGQFEDHAKIAQSIQDAMRAPAGWQALAADQKQALSVIADKIARMLNGDPNYLDNWHDIVGYATLVEQRMTKEQAAPPANDNKFPVICAVTTDGACGRGGPLCERDCSYRG